jgi:hypothetical protein
LRACLPASAENPNGAGVGTRHVLGGHAAGRARPHLTQAVGLQHGQQFSALCAVEHHMEAHFAFHRRVGLVAEDITRW